MTLLTYYNVNKLSKLSSQLSIHVSPSVIIRCYPGKMSYFKNLLNLINPFKPKTILPLNNKNNKSIFNDKISVSDKTNNEPNVVLHNFEAQTISLFVFYESLFINIPNDFLIHIKNVERKALMYKTICFMKNDPYFNVMQHKKMLSVLIKGTISNTKGILSGPKKDALDLIRNTYSDIDETKYVLDHDHIVSFPVLYEIYCGIKFGQDQSSVHKITFRTEDVKKHSPDTQKKSLLYTKQPNCDLQISYKSPFGIFTSFMDVLIGRNHSFKGNVMFVSITDKELIFKELDNNIYRVEKLIERIPSDNILLVSQLKKHLHALITIRACNMTPAAKTISMQEELIKYIPLCREFDPSYNPNMIAFTPINNSSNFKSLPLFDKFKSIITLNGGLHYNMSDLQVEMMLRRTFPMYLHYNKENICTALSKMEPREKQLCIKVIEKWAPEFYDTYKNLL